MVIHIAGASQYIGLSAGDPGDACQFLAEPTIGVNGYARILTGWNGVGVPISGAPVVLSNASLLQWTSTGPWNTNIPISHAVLFTGATGTAESTFLGSCLIDPARLIDRAGIVFTISALQLSFGLEN